MSNPGFMTMGQKLGGSTPSLVRYLHHALPEISYHRGYERIHASEVTYDDPHPFCPRKGALNLMDGTQAQPKSVDTCLSYTFHLGEAMHDRLREFMIAPLVVGDWECPVCGHMHKTQMKPSQCQGCGRLPRKFIYHELRFMSKQCGISGGFDCVVKLPGMEKFTIVEAKTIVAKTEGSGVVDFKHLFSPLPEHSIRTNLYMRLAEESETGIGQFIDTERALILYMIKGYGAQQDITHKDCGILDQMSPFKEFWVERDDSKTQYYTDKARELLIFKTQGVMPRGLIKDDGTCDYVNRCNKATRCFGCGIPPGTKTEQRHGCKL